MIQLRSLEDDELILELEVFVPHPVHRVPTYFFRIVHRVSGEEVGQINLRVGSGEHIERYAGHVGYAIEVPHRGHGYAARALGLLTRLARAMEIDPLWITCDPENAASRRTCERAGAKLVEIVEVPEDCVIRQSGHPRKCRYRLDVVVGE